MMQINENGKLDLTLHSVDPGFCRVVYTMRFQGSRLIYCIQDDSTFGRKAFKLYRCSQDGEPDYEIAAGNIKTIEPPKGDTRIEADVREFLTNVAKEH